MTKQTLGQQHCLEAIDWRPPDWKATPFLLHANFPLPAQVRRWLQENPMPATYEMNAIIQLGAGIPLSPIGKTILSFRNVCPPQADPARLAPACRHRLHLLTYDMVLGKRYAARQNVCTASPFTNCRF